MKYNIPECLTDWMVRRTSHGDMYYVNKVTKVTTYTRPPEFDPPVRTPAAGPPQLPSRTDSSPAAMSGIGAAPNSTGSTTVPTPLPSGSYTTKPLPSAGAQTSTGSSAKKTGMIRSSLGPPVLNADRGIVRAIGEEKVAETSKTTEKKVEKEETAKESQELNELHISSSSDSSDDDNESTTKTDVTLNVNEEEEEEEEEEEGEEEEEEEEEEGEESDE